MKERPPTLLTYLSLPDRSMRPSRAAREDFLFLELDGVWWCWNVSLDRLTGKFDGSGRGCWLAVPPDEVPL